MNQKFSISKQVLVFIASTASLCLSLNANAAAAQTKEFDPFSPNAEKILKEFDAVYEKSTGKSSHLAPSLPNISWSCYRESCPVWVYVSRSDQRLSLYEYGRYRDSWRVSTGKAGFETPDFDRHPNGRIYDEYTSIKFPEGDYEGLGNMPYAVFIEGGFALHGTPRENWRKLGRPASHGCVRQHPNDAYRLNRLIRREGIENVWITVSE